MSIIQEALKKAQSDLKMPEARADTKQVKNTEDIKPAANPVVQKKLKNSKVDKRALKAAALLLVIMAFAAFSVRQFLSKAEKKTGSASTMPTQEVSYRPIVKPELKTSGVIAAQDQPGSFAAARKAAERPNLVLNGIMYLEESPRAIINNFIVQEGDSVSGATITKINRQSVILEYEDVEITLNLK